MLPTLLEKKSKLTRNPHEICIFGNLLETLFRSLDVYDPLFGKNPECILSFQEECRYFPTHVPLSIDYVGELRFRKFSALTWATESIELFSNFFGVSKLTGLRGRGTLRRRDTMRGYFGFRVDLSFTNLGGSVDDRSRGAR